MLHTLVLFDIDGTLLTSGGCGRAATRLALVDIFGTVGALDRASFAGTTDWQVLHDALLPAGISRATIRDRLRTYDDAVARRLAAIIDQFPVQPCPGAPELVHELAHRPDVTLGLVTGNMAGLVPLKLAAAGYDPADFPVRAYGSEGWERAMLPPLALDRARTLTGLDFAPEQVVIVGDTPGDIHCARSIAARTLAVATGPFSRAELLAHGPTAVLESLADLAAAQALILNNGRAPHD